MSKKKIKIRETCKGEDLNSPSKIILKRTGKGLDERLKIKLKNDGGGWTHPTKTRISLEMYDSANSLNKPEVAIKLQDGNKVNMSFLDLCNLRDILVHAKDLGLNWFTDTEVEK